MEDSRELTRQEKTAIRLLVTRWCANYDREYGCRYFREAVLPVDPALEVALTSQAPAASRPCPVCRRPVPRDGRQRYCSPACAKAAHRQQQRAHMRKKRGWGVDN